MINVHRMFILHLLNKEAQRINKENERKGRMQILTEFEIFDAKQKLQFIDDLIKQVQDS